MDDSSGTGGAPDLIDGTPLCEPRKSHDVFAVRGQVREVAVGHLNTPVFPMPVNLGREMIRIGWVLKTRNPPGVVLFCVSAQRHAFCKHSLVKGNGLHACIRLDDEQMETRPQS
jgi:hypothetical protein